MLSPPQKIAEAQAGSFPLHKNTEKYQEVKKRKKEEKYERITKVYINMIFWSVPI